MPAERPPEDIVSPNEDGAVPEVAERVSQDCVLLAVQFSVPTPVLAMVTVCGAGLVKPAVAVKVTAFVDIVNVGIAAFTTNVTFTVCGEDPAPAALTVTVSVYVPAVSPAVATPTAIAAGPLPDVADNESHGWFLLAFQFSVPAPLFKMFRV